MDAHLEQELHRMSGQCSNSSGVSLKTDPFHFFVVSVDFSIFRLVAAWLWHPASCSYSRPKEGEGAALASSLFAPPVFSKEKKALRSPADIFFLVLVGQNWVPLLLLLEGESRGGK